MGLFNFIKQDNGIGLPTNSLRQLTAFLVAYISGRSSDKTGHRILLHVLTHIDTHHIGFVVKETGSQSLRKLGLADAGGAKEQERTDGLRGILNTGLGTDDGFGYQSDCLILTYDTLMQLIVQMQGLVPFTLSQLCHRNTGPTGHDTGNFILSDSFVNQRQILFADFLLFLRKFLLQSRQLAILQLSGLIQVVILLGSLNLLIDILNLLTELLQSLHGSLFIIPLCFLGIELITQLRKLLLQMLQTLLT